jgi:hypothetical protein
MKEIPLTQGKVAIVDDIDYAWLRQWNWHARQSSASGLWYASHLETNPRKLVFMHRLITDAPALAEVDHWDGDGLHNWRRNLRVCTRAQNARNRRLAINNTSGFKGVCKKKGRWCAQIRHGSRYLHIGYFDTAEDAARAYDQRAQELYGKFARLNFGDPIDTRPNEETMNGLQLYALARVLEYLKDERANSENLRPAEQQNHIYSDIFILEQYLEEHQILNQPTAL